MNAKTATLINDIPYEVDFELFQYQGYAVDGTEIYLTQAPVGQNGNIYIVETETGCLLYTSPSPRDAHESRMPSSA